MSLYRWLLFLHLVGLALFLVAHGASAAAALALRRRPAPAEIRPLLAASVQMYNVSYTGLLLVIVTGVWMGFLGNWWGHAWIWAGIAVLLAVLIVMGASAGAFRQMRAAGDDDEKLHEATGRARPLTMTWTGGLALAALLFLMVLKPF